MEKTIKMKELLILLSILLFACSKPIHMKQQVQIKDNFQFNNKAEILEWGKREFGYIGDTVDLNIDGKDIFILFGDYASGIINKKIFMYLKYTKDENSSWSLFLIRQTNTSNINVELDKERKIIVFKSNSGKTILIQPFESLELRFDSEEQ